MLGELDPGGGALRLPEFQRAHTRESPSPGGARSGMAAAGSPQQFILIKTYSKNLRERKMTSTRSDFRIPLAASASVLALLVSAPLATAQETEADGADESSRTLATVTVTAQKRAEDINDVPLTVTALSGDDLQARGIEDPSDLVKVTPGFQYTESFTGSPVYTLRGVGFYDVNVSAGSTVAIYVDETPLPLSVMTQQAGLDVERVEILKGPQGTLFGQNATAGAINYIAAKPTDVFEAGASLEVNNFGRVSGDGYISGPIADTLNARLAVKAVQGGAWQESVSRDAELGDDDLLVGRLILDWHPTENLTFSLNLNGWQDKSDTSGTQFLLYEPNIAGTPADGFYAGFTPVTGDNRAADWTPGRDLTRDAEQFQAALRVDYDINDNLQISSISNYVDYSDEKGVDSDGTALDNVWFNLISTAESFTQEIRLTGDYDRFDYILGVNFDTTETSEFNPVEYVTASVNYLPFAFGGTEFYVDSPYFSDQEYENRAIFGNVDFDLTSRLTAHIGARYTESEGFANSCAKDPGDGTLSIIVGSIFNSVRVANGFDPVIFADGECVTSDDSDPTDPATFYVPGEQAFTLEEDNVSFRAGLDYQFNEDAMLYFNISRGYKAGQLPNLAGNIRSQYAPAKQEGLLSYEAGGKFGLLNNTLQVNAAAFYYDYEDKQFRARILDPIFGPIETMVNIPEANVMGLEAQIDWIPLEGLLISAGGTYLETEVDEVPSFPLYDSFGAVIDVTGSEFPYSPEYQFNVDAEYRWHLSTAVEAFVGGSVYHQSDSKAGFSDQTTSLDPLFELDGYTALDLRAGINGTESNWSAYVFGRNVTDEDYLINVTRFLDTTVGIPGRPSTWGVGLSYKFN